ncbi:tissue factor-like [Alosa sapidissima]|uniref:tissue factor-like n=1 Tax=Alosa sapidissima TaxID=34773 RepID=UPI001C092178|nr:tissue factor-like [Alosa sapidissima]
MYNAALGNVAVLALTLISAISGDNYPPPAQNVAWSSYNFKTILTWSPKPTNYSYSVQYSRLSEDKTMHCIRTRETECDLTDKLENLRSTYTANVISEPLPSAKTDFVELPYASAPHFCPYKETKIGSPKFKVVQNEDTTKMELHVQDPLTAIKRNGRPVNIREIFMSDLMYKVQYSKAGSTGKSKTQNHSNVVKIKKLERGVSYCFTVAAYIKSRKPQHQMGAWSIPVCWPPKTASFFEEVSWYVLAGGATILLFILILLIIMIVLCCKRARLSKQVKIEAASGTTTTTV